MSVMLSPPVWPPALVNRHHEAGRDLDWGTEIHESVISQWVDIIREEDLTTEQHLDKELRGSGKWNLEAWRQEQTGKLWEDSLKYKREENKTMLSHRQRQRH